METLNETGAVTGPRRPWSNGKLMEPKPPLQPKHSGRSGPRLQLQGDAGRRASTSRSTASCVAATW